MLFSAPLQPARLLRRYQRFLADVITPGGDRLTLHCANTGAMTGCAIAGNTVWYSTSNNPARKYAHSWELTQLQTGDWVCVNTLHANRLVRESIEQCNIVELSGYTRLKPEVKYGVENSRIDLLLQADNKVNCYIEIKSVTLLQKQCGYFPDAVTLRGQKHLRELKTAVDNGNRAILFFAALHSGIRQIAPARHIDPCYAQLLAQAQASGVEIMCYGAELSSRGMELKTRLPLLLD